MASATRKLRRRQRKNPDFWTPWDITPSWKEDEDEGVVFIVTNNRYSIRVVAWSLTKINLIIQSAHGHRKDLDMGLSWAHKQRIKNEFFGTEEMAVELFPPESNMLDIADSYHLWYFHNKPSMLPRMADKEPPKPITRKDAIVWPILDKWFDE